MDRRGKERQSVAILEVVAKYPEGASVSELSREFERVRSS